MTSNPKTLMDMYRIDPKKSLGQNFLHDPNTLRKISETANAQPGDVMVEIGPGTGAYLNHHVAGLGVGGL